MVKRVKSEFNRMKNQQTVKQYRQDGEAYSPMYQSYLPSDHSAVLCSLDVRKPNQLRLQVKYRKINNIDLDAFRGDILHSELFTSTPEGTDELVQLYDSVLCNLLNKHAPLMTRSFFPRPHSPWYKYDLHQMKQELRRLERRWMSTKLEVHRQIFKDACCSYKKALTVARRKYHQTQFENCNTREIFQKFQKMYKPVSSLPRLSMIYHTDLIMENKDNQKKLFNIVKSLLNMSNKQHLIPCNIDKHKFVNQLGNYFHDKVLKIHKNIETRLDAMNEPMTYSLQVTSHDEEIFNNFKPLSLSMK